MVEALMISFLVSYVHVWLPFCFSTTSPLWVPLLLTNTCLALTVHGPLPHVVFCFSQRENPYTYQHGSSLSLSVSMMHVCMVGGWKSSINLILYIYTRSPSTCRQRKLSSSSPMDPNNNILY